MVINSVRLRRVEGDIEIPHTRLSLSIDVDSWAWGFTASLPGDALPLVEPNSAGDPVELDANINGTHYRLFCEKIARDRTFGKSAITISGRSKSAVLDAPYSRVISIANDSARTAQQLLADALSVNGVSIGWDIDWQIADWLVPAGTWAFQGSHMQAALAIANAAGAYIQPHATDDEISVMARYPHAPWEWGTVAADFSLPSAVAQREGITWTDYVQYNRVFVSGTANGILGQVTRSGTAGDNVAQMITDPLITAEAAARQRGISILGKTGRIADVSLRLQVLPETGIIVPGKYVEYVDGAKTRFGIVRSTSVESTFNQTWQTIGVETHA